MEAAILPKIFIKLLVLTQFKLTPKLTQTLMIISAVARANEMRGH